MERRAPENGLITCNDGRKMFSVCNFTCLTGYELQGKNQIICNILFKEAVVEWGFPSPVCSKSKFLLKIIKFK